MGNYGVHVGDQPPFVFGYVDYQLAVFLALPDAQEHAVFLHDLSDLLSAGLGLVLLLDDCVGVFLALHDHPAVVLFYEAFRLEVVEDYPFVGD